MTESYGFERGENGISSQPYQSFFDYNREMREANLNSNRINTGEKMPTGEPIYLDFGNPSRITKYEDGRTVFEYENSNQQVNYDSPANARTEQEQMRQDEMRENQSRQIMQALQNIMQALVTLSMLCQRMMSGNDTGYGGGGQSGSGQFGGGYDGGAGGYPDGGSGSGDIPALPQPQPTRPRPERPRPDRPRSETPRDNKPETDAPGKENPSEPGDRDTEGGGANPPITDSGSQSGRYANTGIERGRTIFRDDFSGNRGERPNQDIFDTAHIGADGKTRQRGESIDEDGIISVKNTVQDGNGHLQLFPVKERTYDEVGKEYVNYTKGSMHTTDGLNFNLKDHPDGVAIEVRAKHPTRDGAKFNALWIMTERWAADPSKGESKGDTIEYDAAEGGGADIAIHYPVKDMATGKSKDNYGGGAHPDIDFEDGKFHTYTVVITPNDKTGRGDVVQYIDGKKVFSKENVFPGDKDLHLKSSLEISPKWTKKTLTGPGGMDSDAAGVIDYMDISELKRRS